MEASNLIRVDRFLSNMGIGTRKEVKKMISLGAVNVNGFAVKDSGMLIDENADKVYVKNELIKYKPFVYLMMNKPAGVISASEDAHGETTAADLVETEYGHYKVSPAGRLDKDSEGFLILTNDGDYIHRVITPNKHVEKQYLCRLEKEINDEDIRNFACGIKLLDGTVCRAAILQRAEAECTSQQSGEIYAYVTICEGKFHQVKRMFLAVENKVLYLKRVRIGGVSLDDSLAPGEYREMTEQEVTSILGG